MSISAEANYIFICDSLEQESHGDFIKAFILNEMDMLAYAGRKDIFNASGTKFSFNAGSIEIDKKREFLFNDFYYNPQASYIEEMHERLGDFIYDKRFTGFYAFTKMHLKKAFQKEFKNWVERNKTIGHGFISEIKTSALKVLRKQYYAFDLKWNGKDVAERNDLAFNTH